MHEDVDLSFIPWKRYVPKIHFALSNALKFQLISIKIEKTGGLDWTDYRMIDGAYKNKLFHRRRGQSVEMTAEDARKRGIQRARASPPLPSTQ